MLFGNGLIGRLLYNFISVFQELAEFEKVPDGVKINADTLRQDGFGGEAMFRCLVAEVNSTKEVVGYALYYFIYSTWEGVSVFLEDLYITPSFRHNGIGTKMWRAVAKIAVDRKCCRLDWVCLSWNQQAIDFYKSKGSRNLTSEEDWNLFRLKGEELMKFANGE